MGDKRKNLIIEFVGIFISFCLLFVSCAPQMPDAKTLSDIINKSAYIEIPERVKSPLGESKETEVFLDDSLSMRGFLSSKEKIGETKYCRFLNALRASTIIGDVKFYRLSVNWGQGASKPSFSEVNLYDATHNTDFYDKQYTEIRPLIKYFSSEVKKGKNKSYVIITDGIESSEQETNLIDVSKDVFGVVDENYSFEIIGIESEFEGYVYPSEELRTVGWYSSAKLGERPFYAFIFSPRGVGLGYGLVKEINGFYPDLECRYANLSDFSFLGDARVNFEKVVEEQDFSLIQTDVISDNGKLGNDVNVIYFKYSGEKGKEKTFTVSIKTAYDISNLGISAKYYAKVTSFSYNNGNIQKGDIAVNNCNLDANGNSAYDGKIIMGEEKGWRVYIVSIILDKDAFKWISDFSTDKEERVEDFRKTYLLREFCNLIFSKAENFTIGNFVLVIYS